jgi:arylsulfatase A-like enzyme/tetratricopeptide (TPR) repeat protein
MRLTKTNDSAYAEMPQAIETPSILAITESGRFWGRTEYLRITRCIYRLEMRRSGVGRSATRLVALALGGGLLVACGRSSPTTSALGGQTNVLLVTVDTLRPDRLAPYGNTQVDTPAVARLAREGVRFTASYTAVPLTLPSHTSILTGLQPFTHGVRDNGGFYLDPSRPTLATILKANGFQTAAFVSAFVLDSRWGLNNGFDSYFDNFTVTTADLAAMARVQRTGGETWAEAQRWLDEHGKEKFFLWLHLFDPHAPYTPPEPYRTRYADRPYDGEVAYADSIVGRAIAYLQSHQILDRTLLVFASDHGEGLGEHDEDEHGLLAYDSTLRVPLIVRLPNRTRAGAVIDRPSSLVDVTPTILGLLGISPPQKLDGVNLAAIVTGTGEVSAETVYSETYFPRVHFNWSELVAVRGDRYKLIRGSWPELYDFRADPGETREVSRDHASAAAALDRTLKQMTAADAKAPPTARGLDPDAARRLGALGYVGGGSPASTLPAPGLPDPKDKTAIYRALTRARELLEKGASRDGVVALQAIVLEQPDLEPARRVLREYWLEHRQAREGVAWFTSAAARRPDAVPLLVELGTMQRAAGQLDRATATFEKVLAKAPDSVEVLTAAAETLRAAGRDARALELFEKAAEQGPDAPPRMRVAETLIKMRRLSDADRVLSDALAADPHISGAHYLLAQIGESQHDLARAEREYRLEMTVSSWDYRAPFNLAQLVGARGDHAAQVALLESIPRIAPQFGEVYFYLAKALLDLGDRARFPKAIDAAERGLRMAPESPSAPLGHYVLADIYNLQGRTTDAQREQRLGRELEQRTNRTK